MYIIVLTLDCAGVTRVGDNSMWDTIGCSESAIESSPELASDACNTSNELVGVSKEWKTLETAVTALQIFCTWQSLLELSTDLVKCNGAVLMLALVIDPDECKRIGRRFVRPPYGTAGLRAHGTQHYTASCKEQHTAYTTGFCVGRPSSGHTTASAGSR